MSIKTYKPNNKLEIGIYGPMIPGPRLTLEEVTMLHDGVTIQILWSGGNGPYLGTKETDKRGRAIYRSLSEKIEHWLDDFVGDPPRTIIKNFDAVN